MGWTCIVDITEVQDWGERPVKPDLELAMGEVKPIITVSRTCARDIEGARTFLAGSRQSGVPSMEGAWLEPSSDWVMKPWSAHTVHKRRGCQVDWLYYRNTQDKQQGLRN